MTKLEKVMKREVTVNGEPHVVTLDPTGIKLTKKGCRIGATIDWPDFKGLMAPVEA